MILKEVHLDQVGQQKLRAGLNVIAEAVSSTLGPSGSTAILESEKHIGGRTVTKDGVTVAESINLKDPVENIAVQIVKEASKKTALSAGDGTTTSIVLTRAIVEETDYELTEDSTLNKTEVLRAIDRRATQAIKYLKSKSKKANKTMIKHVATISANNDKFIGDMVAKAYSGASVVSAALSPDHTTRLDIIEGTSFERGWATRAFITDRITDECIMEKPLIFMSNRRIQQLFEISHIIEMSVSQGRPLLLIAELDIKILEVLAANYQKNPKEFRFCNVLPPSFGERRQDVMEDIAMMTGSTLYSEMTGDIIQNATLSDLGTAKKVRVTRDRTFIIGAKNENSEEVKSHIKELKQKMDSSKLQRDRDQFQERINVINGGIGVIYVGGDTASEQKEKFDRVDDSVRATDAAIKHGILPGGGIALLHASQFLSEQKDLDNNDSAAISILATSFLSPIRTILENDGKKFVEVSEPIYANISSESPIFGFGYNVKTKEYGDMRKLGVIDPSLVTIEAIRNSVSTATVLLSSHVTITNIRDYGAES